MFLEEDYDIYRRLMLEYFPCTLDKNAKETEENEDTPTSSVRKPGESSDEKLDTIKEHKTSRTKGRGRENIKTNTSKEMLQKPGESKNEKPDTGNGIKASGGTDRKRGSKKTDTSGPQTLLNMTVTSKAGTCNEGKTSGGEDGGKKSKKKDTHEPPIPADTKTKVPKDEETRHVEEDKKEPDLKNVDDRDGVENMDTPQDDSAKTATVDEGAVESVADGSAENTGGGKGKEHFRKMN